MADLLELSARIIDPGLDFDQLSRMTQPITRPASAGPSNAKVGERFTASSSSRRHPLRGFRNRLAMIS